MDGKNILFNVDIKKHIPFIGLIIILLWTVLEYGARYLQTQVISQIITSAILILLSIAVYNKQFRYPAYPLTIQSFIFMGILCLSFCISINRLASLEEILRYLMYLLLPFIVLCWANTLNRIKLIVYVLILCGLIVSLLSLVPFLYTSLTNPNSDLFLDSPLTRTNDLGAYLLLIFPLPLVLLFVMPKLKYPLTVIFAIIFVTIIFTNSRGVWLSAFFPFLFLLLFFRPQGIKIFHNLKYISGIAALIIISLIMFNFNYVYNRFFSIWTTMSTENSFLWRQSLLRGTWKIFIDNPLVGTGINTFSSIYGVYQERAGYFSINPHNYYLQLLTETGIIGFIGFFVIIISIFYISYLTIREGKKKPELFTLSIGLTASLIGSLVHIGFDLEWSVSAVPIVFWIEVGLICSIYKLCKLNKGEKLLLSPTPVIISLALLLLILPAMNIFSVRFYMKGLDEFQKRNWEKSENDILMAINLAPYPSARHYGLLGLINQYEQKFKEAKDATLKAINLDRYNDHYYTTMASILIKTGDKFGSAYFFKQAIEFNPYKYPYLYSDIAYYYSHILNKKDIALQWLKKGLKAFLIKDLPSYETYNPGHRYELFNVYKALSDLYLELNNKKDAILTDKQGDYILEQQPKIPNASHLISCPTATVVYYWESLDSIRKGKILHPMPVIDKIFMPKKELRFISLEFKELKETLERAEIRYKVMLKKGKAINTYELTDYLILSKDGWQIVERI